MTDEAFVPTGRWKPWAKSWRCLPSSNRSAQIEAGLKPIETVGKKPEMPQQPDSAIGLTPGSERKFGRVEWTTARQVGLIGPSAEANRPTNSAAGRDLASRVLP